jgi:NADP-dependent 3-hydroxy acid dehydrogenase YdfG
MQVMTDEKDKVLLVTGASSGIGEATARHAVQEGFRVALAARSEDKLDHLVADLGSERAMALTCDVTDFEAQQRMVQAVVERFGRLDAVFANAGTGGAPGGFSGAPVESWKTMVDVNILGVAYTLRASLAEVRKARGHVILTGSVAGRRTLAGSMYSATKWAVSAIGYGLREELRGSGVRVTLLEPGMVDTPFFDEPRPDALKPEDTARAVIFALSQPAHVDIHELMILPTPPLGDSEA